jgi:hypothetical protein
MRNASEASPASIIKQNFLYYENHYELNDLYSLPNIVRVVKIKKNEMGWACGAYGGKERCAQGFGGEA